MPGLPDEVALILDRMMAKNPRARYQNAGELVQHLLTAAKHLQVGAEVPEGVLFVETPLPRTGGGRPYLLVALAVAAVAALLWSLEQPTTTPTPTNKTTRPPVVERHEDPKEVKKDGRRDKPPPEVSPRIVRTPDETPQAERLFDADDVTAEKLIAWLNDNRDARNIHIKLANDVKLEVRDKSFNGLVVNADRVTIEPKNPQTRPTIQLDYVGGPVTPCAALTVRAHRATINGIRFLVDAKVCTATLVGLQLEIGDTHQVTGCLFVQANPKEANELTSLLVVADGNQPKLELSQDFFLGYRRLQVKDEPVEVGGQNAVCRKGPVSIRANNCPFGPHATTFCLEGGKEALALEHCSVMLGEHSTVFALLPDSQARLTTDSCLFARIQRNLPKGDGATLIRLPNNSDAVDYSGRDNGYVLDTYLAVPENGASKINLREFQNYLAGRNASDASAIALDFIPFKDVRYLARPAEAVQAFQPYRDMEELRPSDRPGEHLIGVEVLGGEFLAKGLPDAVKRAKPEVSKKLYVDTGPDKKDSQWGIYSTLEDAVNSALPGDTIFIRHNGELTERTIRLENAKIDLTIKPAPDYKPILTLDASEDLDSSLFRLHGGKVQFEGLEILLRPRKAFRSQSFLTMLGDGQASFKDCVVTLDQGVFGSTPLSMVLLPDPSSAMKMDPPTPRVDGLKPHLSFTNCFVRGTGDLIANHTGRPFDLEATRSLIALTGSLCHVYIAGNTAPSAQPSVLRLERTTTFLGEHLLHVQGKNVTDIDKLPLHQIVAAECLFLPRDNRQPLIRFESKDSDGDTESVKEKLKEKLVWESEKPNAFGTFDTLLTHWQTGEAEQKIDLADWSKFGKNKLRVPLADPKAMETPVPKLTPTQLRSGDPNDFGADPATLQKLLIAPVPR